MTVTEWSDMLENEGFALTRSDTYEGVTNYVYSAVELKGDTVYRYDVRITQSLSCPLRVILSIKRSTEEDITNVADPWGYMTSVFDDLA